MTQSKAICFAGTLAGFLLALPALSAAVAGPLNVVSNAALSPTPTTEISDALYRRPVRRHDGVGAGAVLGLFGAVLGGVIANQRYDNYSNYSYGQPSDYGYAPGYAAGPVYQDRRARAGGRVNRGGGFARGGGGAHPGKR